MKLPEIIGIIDRRILINYTIDLDILKNILPKPFKPQVFKSKGIGGICLIRLKKSRPKGFPSLVGVASENAAHRFAVEWTHDGVTHSGVYVPRRDTSLWLNSIIGGRLFPGVYHHADFNISEEEGTYAVSFKARNDSTSLSIQAKETDFFPKSSIFSSLEEASYFFEKGSAGFSPAKEGAQFDGLELVTKSWKVHPLSVDKVQSSFLENTDLFPTGSVQFDHALLMKNIDHSWLSGTSLDG